MLRPCFKGDFLRSSLALVAALVLGCAAAAISGRALAQIRISEVRVDQPDPGVGVSDPDEYFELVGPPGASLDGLNYIVVGDSLIQGGNSGTIEANIDLDGRIISPSGRFVVAETTFTLGGKNFTGNLTFEDAGTVTHLLVSGLTGGFATSIDIEQDGIVDNTPWDEVLDVVAIIDPDDDTHPYGPGGICTSGPTCSEIVISGADPGHVYRCGSTGAWIEGAFDPDSAAATDSPTAVNPCVLPPLFADGFE